MLIFGGETTDGALHNTMWRFDLGEKHRDAMTTLERFSYNILLLDSTSIHDKVILINLFVAVEIDQFAKLYIPLLVYFLSTKLRF